MNINKKLQKITYKTFSCVFPHYKVFFDNNKILIKTSKNDKFGDYQCDFSMKLSKIINLNPMLISNIILLRLLKFNIFEKIEIKKPGFINFFISKKYLEFLSYKMITENNLYIKPIAFNNKVYIDYSSPNIAKNMHVGHLRSTIIGDSIKNLLNFLGFQVTGINHIGDWGTQFGILIEYIKRNEINFIDNNNIKITELNNFYKEGKVLFDDEEEFAKQAKKNVINLQNGNISIRKIWAKFCSISSISFNKIYKILDVNLFEQGESFYNSNLQNILNRLEKKEFLRLSKKAQCVYLSGFFNKDKNYLPLIVKKMDGGFNYAITDLAALNHRIRENNANWLIYCVDVGQTQHFKMIFATSKISNITLYNKVKINHIPFGLVLRNDGKKFKTREGENKKLIDLLKYAIKKSFLQIKDRNKTINNKEANLLAIKLGINAIKYNDLSSMRTKNYKFSYSNMLNFEGNTAIFLCYSYVRIISIFNKCNKNYNEIKMCYNSINIYTLEEKNLLLQICQFNEVIMNFYKDFYPHVLCDYLYLLSEKFNIFFHRCYIKDNNLKSSRLLICELTRKIFQVGMNILGLKIVKKM